MEKLTGKTIIFTDLHCGLGGNRQTRLNMCAMVIRNIAKAIQENSVKNVIFGGDWYHNRSTLDLNTINVSLKLIQVLSKRCRCLMIVGNHDAYLKNSTDINSLNMFRDTPNVTVFDKADEIELNGQRCLLVPWLADLSKYEPETFDLAVGHFEVSSKYLVQAYAEEHSGTKRTVSAKTAAEIDSDDLLSDGSSSQAAAMVGSFVDLIRENGYIYAGHIHLHREFRSRNRHFVFVGSPYEQNLGDIGDARGYYLLDEQNFPKFISIDDVPKHVQVFVSKAVKDKYDFSVVSRNIVQKVYDADISQKEDAIITQKITDFKPYEELVPDYRVKLDFSATPENGSSLDVIKKSKLEYMKNYVEGIDQAALDEQKLDRDKVFSVLEEYYKKVTED